MIFHQQGHWFRRKRIADGPATRIIQEDAGGIFHTQSPFGWERVTLAAMPRKVVRGVVGQHNSRVLAHRGRDVKRLFGLFIRLWVSSG